MLPAFADVFETHFFKHTKTHLAAAAALPKSPGGCDGSLRGCAALGGEVL